MSNKKLELLAPAGSMEALAAAIQNGADAVYLGGKLYSARASANNFDNTELEKAVDYAHLRDARIYVAVNTLLDENEVEKAINYIAFLYRIGVDAIILQDLGLAEIIREVFPDLKIHASTQMTVNSLEAAKFVEKAGFSRVITAREISKQETKLISENTNLEIESFVHGALCISYSGQCLMSSFIGSRSGNRGKCAQCCRKSYKITDKNHQELKFERAYFLSPKELCTIENLSEYIDSGVTSFKIEGRMKRPDYVATVVNAYRKAIDNRDLSGESEKLLQVFNRGFTKGFYFGDFGNKFAAIDRPGNRGIIVGKVLKLKKNSFSINLDKKINAGDILEFKTQTGYKTIAINSDLKIGLNELKAQYNPLPDSYIARIKDEKIYQQALKSYKTDDIRPDVDFIFKGNIGNFAKLIARSNGIEVSVESEKKVQKSINSPVTKSQIKEKLEKIGETGFKIGKIKVEIDDEIFLPISEINKIKRNAVSALDKELKLSFKREYTNVFLPKKRRKIEEKDFKLSVSISTKEQYEKLNLKNIERIYLRFLDEKTISELKAKNKKIFYRSDKILNHEDYIKLNNLLKNRELDGVLIDNLGGIIGFENFDKIADIGLNIFNSYAIDLLKKYKINHVVLSPELTFSQISEIRRNSDCKIETLGYGFLEVMTLKHCPFSVTKNCKDDANCENCKFSDGYFLRDEKDVDFRTLRQNKQTTIFNSYPLSIIDELNRVKKAGIDYLLIDFTFEDDPQFVLSEFKKALGGQKSDLNEYLKTKYKNFTRGHYLRGVE